MKPAIRIENLSKQYRIGTQKRGVTRNLTESIVDGASAVWRGLTGCGRGGEGADAFWALKDVSFELQPGEVVGIIGRNGAGKSTLLKILSRITEPTSGRAVVRGRLGSLLEVGTGFHPELTGRENIYLNGSILGMSRQEIGRKFEEIVAFSEIEQFLDTPVKRYSSGMYVRLAFAVAAHLEPEILVVDEVLAVGDAAFQRKCLGQMGAAAHSGRTVLLVSHNMAAIQSLCNMVILLRQGQVAHIGDADAAIAQYMSEAQPSEAAEVDLTEHTARRPGCQPLLRRVRFMNTKGEPTLRFKAGETLLIELTVDPSRSLHQPQFGIGVDDVMGLRICSWCTYLSVSELPQLARPSKVICRVDRLPLIPGKYVLSLSAGVPHDPLLDALDQAVTLEVVPADFFGNGQIHGVGLGRCLVASEWSLLSA